MLIPVCVAYLENTLYQDALWKEGYCDGLAI